MAYNNAIPAANDLLSQSQDDILQNFIEIKTLIDIDHETFGAANQGKHKQVTLPEQGADPATAANEVAVYSKLSTEGALGSALFLRHEGSGTVTDFTSSTQAANGWTRLPSGILLKWGSGTTAGGAQVFALPVAATVPKFATIYSVSLTPNGDGGTGVGYYDYMPYLTGFTAAPDQINIYGSARTVNATRDNINFRYLVIGI